MGKPTTSLPVSQLVLGRTTPPWHAFAWKSAASCAVHGDVLRIAFSGGLPGGLPGDGCNFKARPLCLPARDAVFHYKVRFGHGFDWGRGGKLPGFFIGTGSHGPDGASARLKWLEHGKVVASVSVPTTVRQKRSYNSSISRRGSFGDDEMFESGVLVFDRGARWNDVVLRVKLNGFDDDETPVHDGILTVSVNGKAVTRNDMVWRARKDVLIQNLAITVFLGGKWTCPSDTWAEFKDFWLVA